MTLFEWEEGNPIPRIIEVVGEDSDDAKSDSQPSTTDDVKDDLDHLLGEDSPFFEPRGRDGSDFGSNYKRTKRRR